MLPAFVQPIRPYRLQDRVSVAIVLGSATALTIVGLGSQDLRTVRAKGPRCLSVSSKHFECAFRAAWRLRSTVREQHEPAFSLSPHSRPSWCPLWDPGCLWLEDTAILHRAHRL